ncbi:hypothetical protein HWB57_gp157 [Erwinia phage vB_EamM-Bue1]|uniref:Uncharacterized protein n=1 Tax=Erwinia phage vB_EamM-Bue1 TaxID=2099338 RepID=A0A2P1JUG5_9CAUD|nr:hypothetical protein HWB57_gp157 [Erwinia phage vB_EamM-Bue1]AVO22994.1 hypothetical protein [Erwinia phage vB_EamM-Bue1]
MKQRISTIINDNLTPILLHYAGQVWTPEFARAVQRDIYEKTGKYVGFRSVNIQALKYAQGDINHLPTFSFNIVPLASLVDEYNLSSDARRARFANIYNPRPLLDDKVLLMNRFQIALPSIRSKKQFDVQVIIDSRGKTWPVAVIGYYGSNMNSWAKRVGLQQTFGPHKHPSTHYMSSSMGAPYVHFLVSIAEKFV